MTGAPRVLVVGGGISGLVAARTLSSHCEVVVADKNHRFGGNIGTATFRGRPVDVGPDAFITRNDAATQLCRALGLETSLTAPSRSAAGIVARGHIRPFPKKLTIGIPTSPIELIRSGVVSPFGALRSLVDQFAVRSIAPRDFAARVASGDFDPSVGALIRRRLGNEVAEVLVDPLIGGINASNIDLLSFAGALPQFVDQMAGKTSIMRALAPPKRPTPSSAPAFYGLAGGLGTLIDRLVIDCTERGVTLRLGTDVHALAHTDGTWSAAIGAERETFDGVVIATPSYVTASLLADTSPVLSALCASIAYASVTTLTAAWPTTVLMREANTELYDRKNQPVARRNITTEAGVLVPRRYGHLITAASFTSSKWPNSANPDETVIRCSMGRHGDERSFAMDDNELTTNVLRDLRTIFSITTAPNEVLISRFPKAFPQYTKGHHHKVAEIKAACSELSLLVLCGAAYEGIGIPACVQSGEQAAQRLVAQLGTI